LTKAEWGTKRACPHCGAKFYDMMKSPIVCPKCEKVVEPEAPTRSRRSATPKPVAPPPKVEVPVVEPIEAEVEEVEDAEVVAEGAEEAEEAEVIEDTSDLGEDEDDVAEVLENVDESPEEER
jgi:uncharacterized protein (TIGR02300 family)